MEKGCGFENKVKLGKLLIVKVKKLKCGKVGGRLGEVIMIKDPIQVSCAWPLSLSLLLKITFRRKLAKPALKAVVW